jgi:hypothetical protein
LEGNELLSNDSFGLDLLERLSDQKVPSPLDSKKCSTGDESDLVVDKQVAHSQHLLVELLEQENGPLAEPQGTSPLRKRDRPQDSTFDDWEGDALLGRESKKSEVVQQLEIDAEEFVESGKEIAQDEEVDIPIDLVEDATREDAPSANEPALNAKLDIDSQIRELDGAENREAEAKGLQTRGELQCSSGSKSEPDNEEDEEVRLGRKHGRRRDRNPKPSKRRRAVPEPSPVSEKYHRESLCGAEDRLHDGFYDPGRERPFLRLEEFEREKPCVNSREVILVDRWVRSWGPYRTVCCLTASVVCSLNPSIPFSSVDRDL